MIFPEQPIQPATPADMHQLLETIDTLVDSAVPGVMRIGTDDATTLEEWFCFEADTPKVGFCLRQMLGREALTPILPEYDIQWELNFNRTRDGYSNERLRESSTAHLAWLSLCRTIAKPKRYGGAIYNDSIDYDIGREPGRPFAVARETSNGIMLQGPDHKLARGLLNLYRAGENVQPQLDGIRFQQEDVYEYCRRAINGINIARNGGTLQPEDQTDASRGELSELTELLSSLSVLDQREYEDL